jgi:hypothetical protein
MPRVSTHKGFDEVLDAGFPELGAKLVPVRRPDKARLAQNFSR